MPLAIPGRRKTALWRTDGLTASLYINGRFLTQRTTGVQRSATETVMALDRILAESRPDMDVTLLCPHGTHRELNLDHIRIRQIGRTQGQLWEQIELPIYSARGFLVNLANLGPLARRNQAVVIHDAQVWAIPENFAFSFRTWYRFALPILGRRCRLLITVSDFSRRELIKYKVVVPSRTKVLPNGADHILRIRSDNSVLERNGLTPGRFVLAVGSDNRNKNFSLLAAASPGLIALGLDVAVVGSVDRNVFGHSRYEQSEATVRRVGYIDDAGLRALYENALCFVIPSLYEGFGLPAVEAMTCGCPVVASKQGALSEVCGDAALYCSAHEPADLVAQVACLADDDGLREGQADKGRRRAQNFTWNVTAERLINLVCEEISKMDPA